MEFFAKKKKRGFTLIELLVVIAIIGILAAIVLVSLGGVRDRAKDSAIVTNLNQIRSTAEVHYGAQTPNSYATLCANTDAVTLQNDTCFQKGQAAACTGAHWDCNATGSAYCISSELNSGAFWCVDSTLVAKQYSAAPTCDAATNDFTCEP